VLLCLQLDVEASADSFASSISRTPSHSMTRSESSVTMTSIGGGPELDQAYHIRVLIPCYREPIDIVQKTLNATRDAALPAGTCCSCASWTAVQQLQSMLLRTLLCSYRFEDILGM